jgi:translation initiation factor 3 subunit K
MEYHAANSGWVIEKGGRSQLIVLPRNEFNHPELKKNAADTVPFEHITRIFPVLS